MRLLHPFREQRLQHLLTFKDESSQEAGTQGPASVVI
jgi:hypothetical protein